MTFRVVPSSFVQTASNIPTTVTETSTSQVARRSLYNNFIINQHNDRLKNFFGLDLSALSHKNFKELKNRLRQGAAYLEQCTAGAKLSSIEHMAYQGLLTAREAAFFECITTNLTLKHATANIDFLKDSSKMLSLKSRERKCMPIKNRHTYTKFGVDDSVYFVLGIGDHPTPSFLNDHANHIITINLDQMQRQDPHTTKRLWVSGHVSDYMSEHPSPLLNVGGALFEYTHSWDDKSKQYRVKRSDGTEFVWKVHYNDECFLGAEVAPSIAYQFILLLRFLGHDNPYVTKLYQTVMSENEEEKIAALSLAMTTFFPGWVYPEAKIMNHLDTSRAYVDISSVSEIDAKKEMSYSARVQRVHALLSSVRNGDFAMASYLMAQGISPNEKVRESDNTLIMEAIDQFKHDDLLALRMVQFLVDSGANPLLKSGMKKGANALHTAIECNLPAVVRFLLQSEYPHETEPLIKYRMRPDCSGGDEGNAVGLAITGKRFSRRVLDGTILQILIEFGADIHRNGQHNLSDACEAENWEALQILVNAGVQLNSEKVFFGKTALMVVAASGNEAALRDLLNRGADPDVQFRFRCFSPLIGKYLYGSNENGNTALHFAAQNGHEKVVKLLLQVGANKNVQNCAGKRAQDLATKLEVSLLFAAAKQAPNPIVEPLQPHKNILYNPNEQHQVVCLITGINRSGKPCVLMGRKRDKNGTAKEEYILPGGMVDETDLSLEKAVLRELEEETGIKNPASTPVLITTCDYIKKAKKHHTSFFHLDGGDWLQSQKTMPGDDLIDLRLIPLEKIVRVGDQFTYDNIPVRTSNAVLAKKIDTESISSLVELEEVGYELLCQAAKKNDTEEIRRLLGRGVRDGRHIFATPPIIPLVAFQNYEAITLLLQAGFDINAFESNSSVEYPLRSAILARDLAMVVFLLQNGANPKGYWDTYEPVHCAIKLQSEEMLQLLLGQEGIDVNYANNYEAIAGTIIKTPPLETAIKEDARSIVQYLIETARENINREKTLNKQHSMLQAAIRYKRREMALYLLALQTSDLAHKANSGETAHQLALDAGWHDVANIIAFYERYHTFTDCVVNKTGVEPTRLEWHEDEHSEPTLHVYFATKQDATRFNAFAHATIREDIIGPYVRLGKVRLRTFMGSSDVATFFYNMTRKMPFWHVTTLSYRKILQNELKEFTLTTANWTYLSTLLRQNNSITELTLDFQHIDRALYPDIVATFKSQGNIRRIHCQNMPDTELIFALAKVLPSLKELYLSNVSEQHALQLVTLALEHISIQALGLSEAFFTALCTHIQQNASSTTFTFPGIDARYEKMVQKVMETVQLQQAFLTAPAGVQKEIEMIARESILHASFHGGKQANDSFEFSQNHLHLIIHTISHNVTLQELQISHMKFQKEALHRFAACLTKHPSLHSIDLSSCSLDDEAVVLLCDTLLKRRITLSHLSLQSNRAITAKAIQALCRLLNNEEIQLKSLDISFCELENDALVLLVNALRHDRYLKILDMEYNNFSKAEFNSASTALLNNQTLTIVELSVFDKLSNALEARLQANRQLELSDRRGAGSIFQRVYPNAVSIASGLTRLAIAEPFAKL